MELADQQAFRDTINTVSTNLLGQALPTVQHQGLTLMQVPNPEQIPFFLAVQNERLLVGMSPDTIKGHLDWLGQADRQTMPSPRDGTLELGMLDLGLLLTSYPEPASGPILTWRQYRDGNDLVSSLRLESDEELPPLARVAPVAVPVGAALLMPALTRARAAARATTGKANLHNIGLGIAMYREDHDGQFPPNLKTLLDDGYLDDEAVFRHPDDHNAPAVDGLKTSYVYIGTPLPRNLDPRTPIAYTRGGVLRQGRRNVLFDDNAVMETRGKNFQRMDVRQAYEDIVRKLGDRATDERKKELREFFGLDDE
jgi:hypothetical protein